MSYVGNKPAQTTIPADDAVTTAMLKDDAVTSAKIDDLTIVNADINASAAIANSKMATDTTNATNLATGTVPTARLGSGSASSSTFLRGDQTYAAVDTSGITANQDDIALLGFKVAANGSLAKYNLVDQTIDAFEDASGVDASASTNEIRDSSKYYSGSESGTVAGNDSYTKLLLHADGSNGGTTFTDSSSSGRSVTPGGDVHTDTTIKKIGTASAQFDGTGDYLQMADSADFNYGSGDFTIDFWCYVESFGGYGYNQEAGSNWLRAEMKEGGIEFNLYNSGSYANGWATQLPWTSGDIQDSWHHIALERDGTVMRGYIDGTEITMVNGDEPGTNTMPDIASVVWLGGKVSGSGYYEGYLDEFRISKGIARYDADFTPETRAGYGEAYATYNNMTLISNATTAVDGAPTTGDLVITYTDGVGTASVNTDLKAYISRDGSAYTSAVTLVSQGTTGGHTILTANGVDLSGITTGTSMRWKIETLNQSVSKVTRIQAVSLGWS